MLSAYLGAATRTSPSMESPAIAKVTEGSFISVIARFLIGELICLKFERMWEEFAKVPIARKQRISEANKMVSNGVTFCINAMSEYTKQTTLETQQSESAFARFEKSLKKLANISQLIRIKIPKTQSDITIKTVKFAIKISEIEVNLNMKRMALKRSVPTIEKK